MMLKNDDHVESVLDSTCLQTSGCVAFLVVLTAWIPLSKIHVGQVLGNASNSMILHNSCKDQIY